MDVFFPYPKFKTGSEPLRLVRNFDRTNFNSQFYWRYISIPHFTGKYFFFNKSVFILFFLTIKIAHLKFNREIGTFLAKIPVLFPLNFF